MEIRLTWVEQCKQCLWHHSLPPGVLWLTTVQVREVALPPSTIAKPSLSPVSLSLITCPFCTSLPLCLPFPSDPSPLHCGDFQQINDFIEKEPVVPLGAELTFPRETWHIILSDLAFLSIPPSITPSAPLPCPLCLSLPTPTPLLFLPLSSLLFHDAENRALFLGPDSCGRHIWRQWPQNSHPGL